MTLSTNSPSGSVSAALALAGFATLLGAPAAAQEGGGADDLFDLSIEELLRIRVPSMTNVLGGHIHNEGDLMPMVHYGFMEMDGMRDGTDDLRTADIVTSDFLVTPVEMSMRMLMLGLMYAPSDEWTLMAMVPFIENEMRHRTRPGGEFTTRSDGAGDLKLSAMTIVSELDNADIIANATLSVPTGSIDERDTTPMGSGSLLPYPMQLGSGTYDVIPGITMHAESGAWAWGAQAKATLRIGENDNDYRLGNRFEATGWLDRKWTDAVSTSARLIGQSVGNISGADPRLNPAVVPTADPDRQGRERIDLALGFQYYNEASGGHRVSLEVGKPLYESLDGPQLSTEYWVRFSYSLTIY